MKRNENLDHQKDEIGIKDKNKFTTKEKVKLIISAVIFLFIAIGFLVSMYTTVWRPYPEIEDTYYLYHDSHDENNTFKIKGKKWVCGEEKGEVIYNKKTESLTLIYGKYDSDTHKVKGYWLNGYLTNGVAYLYSQDDNYYCYCVKGKTPSKNQELDFSSVNFLNYTEAKEDDEVCSAVTGPGTYYNSEIVIPEKYGEKKVIEISEGAFKGCDWITSITIPKTVLIVQKDAFTGCTGAIKSVDGILYVDNWVVGFEANCKNAKIKDGTVGIAEYAFFEAKALESVVVPSSVKYIGDAAFFGCQKLASVTLSNGVSIIGGNAFNMCTSLKEITIPSSVRFLGGYCFFGNKTVNATILGSSSQFDPNWNTREKN